MRTASLEEAAEQVAEAEWFMDYRNADGSVAEMCGNGIRVFVAFLEHEGLISLDVDAVTTVATRAGTLTVRKDEDGYAADMGLWTVPGGEGALADGFDVTVALAGLDEPRPGLRLNLPNPHTVIALADGDELADIDLSIAPRLEPEPEAGSNVELVVPLGEREVEVVDPDGAVVGTEMIGVVQMRVHERGVGETLSCGTGACAAAIATRIWFGDDAPAGVGRAGSRRSAPSTDARGRRRRAGGTRRAGRRGQPAGLSAATAAAVSAITRSALICAPAIVPAAADAPTWAEGSVTLPASQTPGTSLRPPMSVVGTCWPIGWSTGRSPSSASAPIRGRARSAP